MRQKATPQHLELYAAVGFLIITSSYYFAYYLAEPMFRRDGTNPDINFLALSLPGLIGPGLFPLPGIVFAVIPTILSYVAVRLTMHLRGVITSAVSMLALLVLAGATSYTFIPFAIASVVTLGALAGVVTVIIVFRRTIVNSKLPRTTLGRPRLVLWKGPVGGGNGFSGRQSGGR